MKKILCIIIMLFTLITLTACSNDKENKNEVKEIYVLLSLNMRLSQEDRIKLYEDYLDDVVQEKGYGYVTGGGTWLEKGEPSISEVEFYIYSNKLNDFITLMKENETIAKGSYLEYNEEKVSIGTLEGLVFSIINKLANEVTEALKENGKYYSHYIGENNTSLYFYGTSYEEMKIQIEEYNKTCSVCENITIEKIKN